MTSAYEDVAARLHALPADRHAAVAAAFAKRVATEGLHVVKQADDGTVTKVPIPPLLTPVAPEPEAAPAARVLLASVIAVARALFENRIPTPAGLFTGFTKLEAECVHAGWRDAERVASARVDFLRDETRGLRALEVNATIPAMQGYSDIVAAGWVRDVAPALGATSAAVAAALARLPSNVDDLRRSLLAHAAETGSGRPGKWALLARANDSQDGELTWMANRFREAGLDAIRITPESFSANAPYDLVYRHLFARRVEPGSPLEPVYRAPRKNALWNPVNAHLEVKGMLALLSAATSDGKHAATIGLSLEQIEVARRHLPWTRLLLPGAAIGPASEALADLPAWVAANAQTLVLKRSWDYGGRSVFLAEDFARGAVAGLARAAAQANRPITTWEDLVRFAAVDPDGDWIVQERVIPFRKKHLRVVDGIAEWSDLVTDVSAYTGHGAAFTPSGLTSRASSTVVVNIVSGGGMAPILSEEILHSLLP